MATLVSTYEAKAHLSRLLSAVEKTGRTITICRNHRPVADLVAHRDVADPLVQNPALKGARFCGNPCNLVDEVDWPVEAR